MKIFELLSGDVGTEPQPELQSPIAPIGAVQSPAPGPTGPMGGPAGAPGAQPPMQTAGLWDMAKDFMTTPQPIGGPAAPPAPTPPTPGQPPAQSSGMVSRPFGGSAIGRNLDAINTGLQPKR